MPINVTLQLLGLALMTTMKLIAEGLAAKQLRSAHQPGKDYL